MQRFTFQTDKKLPLPVFAHTVPAGFPSPASDYEEDKLDLNEYLIKHPSATFILRVAGDSMQGVGIYENDLLIVDRSLLAQHDKVVVAVLDGEVTVKRLVKEKGKVFLCAENPAYSPIDVTHQSGFSIWGVVVGVVRSLS